jgi:hypothetical protein
VFSCILLHCLSKIYVPVFAAYFHAKLADNKIVDVVSSWVRGHH